MPDKLHYTITIKPHQWGYFDGSLNK